MPYVSDNLEGRYGNTGKPINQIFVGSQECVAVCYVDNTGNQNIVWRKYRRPFESTSAALDLTLLRGIYKVTMIGGGAGSATVEYD